MTMISDQAHVILASLRENVEGTEHRGPCDDWGIVYLDNAQNAKGHQSEDRDGGDGTPSPCAMGQARTRLWRGEHEREEQQDTDRPAVHEDLNEREEVGEQEQIDQAGHDHGQNEQEGRVDDAARDNDAKVDAAFFDLLGATIDDAAGEAFDKSAKLMGLPYPGGPALSRLAEAGNPQAFKLPRPLLHSGDLDFSFAGLKTAVLTQTRKLGKDLAQRSADLAASTQAAIVEVLVKKTMTALRQTGAPRLVVAGGVGANQMLRLALNQSCQAQGVRVHYPELSLCTDNGAMIAMAAALRLQAGMAQTQSDYGFDVRPRWPLEELSERIPI